MIATEKMVPRASYIRRKRGSCEEALRLLRRQRRQREPQARAFTVVTRERNGQDRASQLRVA